MIETATLRPRPRRALSPLQAAPRGAAAAGRGAAPAPHAAGSNGAAATTALPVRGGRVATSPAIRRRAHEAGIDLQQVAGSGPNGRIVPKDLDAYVARRGTAPTPLRSRAEGRAAMSGAPAAATEEIKVIGLRRLIAQRMSEAKRNIPHFAYVEELDITELESLRRHLNRKRAGRRRGAHLPAVPGARSGARAARVPAVQRPLRCRARRASCATAPCTWALPRRPRRDLRCRWCTTRRSSRLWELAAEMRRVSEAARSNKATREELERLDHHDHEPGQARRHRQHPDHQRPGGGDHRRQPRRGACRW